MSCIKCTYIHGNPTDYITKCDRHNEFNKIPIKPKHHEGNGRPTGAFAGTLNMSWEWNENEDTIVEAMKNILNQQTCPVKRFRWNLEFCKDGKPHVHFLYETKTGGRIHSKVFKRYWPYWGEDKYSMIKKERFTGGYHQPCSIEEAYIRYMNKDKGRCGLMDE